MSKWIAISVSAIAVIISLFSLWYTNQNYTRSKYDDKPSFNIVQNLWNNNPSYSLVNESKKKLRQPPHPTYYMSIPSIVHVQLPENNGSFSTMVLTPVSYTFVKEQIESGNSIGEIEKSTLPQTFFGKKGERSIVRDTIHKTPDGVKFKVETYPMLIIATEIDYSYTGDMFQTSRFITTPLGKLDISKDDLRSLKQYLSDNSKLEVTDDNHSNSVYKNAQRKIQNQMNLVFDKKTNLKEHPEYAYFISGKKGGYNQITKRIRDSLLPHDPMSKDRNS